MNAADARKIAESVAEETIDAEQDPNGEEVRALSEDPVFQSLAIAFSELESAERAHTDSGLDFRFAEPVSYARTFSDTARGNLRLAISERAQALLGRSVPHREVEA